MMRSLYSAISGLKNHQIKMDVIGNNIANVNTTGFKRSRVTFSTMLSQTLKGASAPVAGPPTLGGTNSIQVGLGASLGSIDQIMTQGSSQSTGNPTDMMIQGSGFFVLTTNGTDKVYSRAGAFSLDSNGTIIDPATGAQLLDTAGAPIKITPDTYSSYSIDSQGTITGIQISDSLPATIGNIGIAKFPNDAGLTSRGGNFYQESNNSGTATVYGADTTPYPSGTALVSNTVEMSNVDLSTEFTDMIVAQRGFQANSRVITVSDSLLQELIDLKRQ
ncbi:flagellar hook-basal body complex protein [Desulfosporosinus sp. Sb-LF]|uniref:flagellar hook-basal body complex protein n=1 Tax=Desulfosporosinus sp. Sb-LF TaxID=2560027 RepID=UPI00107F5EAF|nr:flagellar hook-basal body complex protein [Desulfosporosinus sp. Sb-LF]TGE32637.1 flagellar hook-basal body complex protein [Desulfosporosinus sp. Sb-LF]